MKVVNDYHQINFKNRSVTNVSKIRGSTTEIIDYDIECVLF